MMRLALIVVAVLVVAVLVAGCTERVENVVLHRSSCTVCHQPLNGDGEPEGIGDPHPWHALSCVDCHGGNPYVCTSGPALLTADGPKCDDGFVYVKDRAHPSPGSGPSQLRRLSSRQLDATDPNYLRFINPGDLRVAQFTCGGSSPGAGGSGCHSSVVDRVALSLHTHAGGELAPPRFRAMAQSDRRAMVAAIDAGQDPGGELCALTGLSRLDPQPINPVVGASFAQVQDHYLVKTCARCHLSDFGRNEHRGEYRSSGCSACHVPYADDGLGVGADPWMDPMQIPRPVTHTLRKTPSDTQCAHCHNQGARIGLAYRGLREAGADDPTGTTAHPRTLYGLGKDGIIIDEDDSNDWDETPPDVHFEAGMACVDCHGGADVHGTGGLESSATCTPGLSCTDCHGDARAAAKALSNWPALEASDDGVAIVLRDGRTLAVPQVINAVTDGHASFNPAAQQAMGVREDGTSHLDNVECATCHSGWLSSCYGCHVEVDLAGEGRSLTTGALSGGAVLEVKDRIALHDLVLVAGPSGKLAPSMPTRLVMSLNSFDTASPITDHPRRFMGEDGPQIGFGQRAIHPHTIRRRSSFQACNRCHSEGTSDTPDNAALLNLTFGHGTDRFVREVCDVVSGDGSCSDDDRVLIRLDATRDAGRPQVVVGPPGATLLTDDDEARMRAVIVPVDAPISVPPPGSLDDRTWPPPLKPL